MRSPFLFLFIIFFLSAPVRALDISQKDFCLQFNSGQGEKAVRTELLTRRIKVEEGVNPHLLGVLVGIFREYQFYGPLQIKLDASSGPRKAWVTGTGDERVLWLAKNASDLILGQEVQKVVDKVCGKTLLSVHELSISWTNTVYEQVLRELINPDMIIRRFLQVSGWALQSPPTDSDLIYEQPFRNEELVTVMKQFIDLPHEVLSAFDLKYLARARVGRDVDGAAGIYYPAKKKILLTDGAFFSGKDIYGEGTVLHEFGHAWWYAQRPALQERFTLISWQRDGSDWIKRNVGIKGFVSEYAATKPEEDFAETFSAFINEPEKLLDVSREKFLFLRQYAFKDITYFSTVAENAKVFIDSQTTDKKPPFLDDKVKHCLSFTTAIDATKDQIKLQGRLDCVWDLMSGPADTLISLEHETVKNSRILMKLAPLPDRKIGEPWVLTGETEEKLSKLAKGRYLVPSFGVEDNAGNRDYFDGKEGPFVYIDGGMGTAQPSPPPLDWSRIQLKPLPPVLGHTRYEVVLPIEHRETLDSIHLDWYHEVVQEKSAHVLSGRDFLSKPGDPSIRAHISLHREHPTGPLSLNNLTFFYKGSATTRNYNDQYTASSSDQRPVHQATSSQDMRPDADVNKMVLSAVQGPNLEGGQWSIKMRIPIERHEQTQFSIYVRARTPTGGGLGFLVSETLLEKDGHKLVREGGRLWLEAILPLKIHPERGNYIFESIELTASPQYERGAPDNLDQLKFIRRIKFLERGIKKEFRITPSDKLDMM